MSVQHILVCTLPYRDLFKKHDTGCKFSLVVYHAAGHSFPRRSMCIAFSSTPSLPKPHQGPVYAPQHLATFVAHVRQVGWKGSACGRTLGRHAAQQSGGSNVCCICRGAWCLQSRDPHTCEWTDTAPRSWPALSRS